MTLPHLNTLEKLRGTNSGDYVRLSCKSYLSVRIDRE